MMQKNNIHKVGNRVCLVAKVDGKQVQVLFIPSCWKDKYYVITENMTLAVPIAIGDENPDRISPNPAFICALWEKKKMIAMFGDIVNEIIKT